MDRVIADMFCAGLQGIKDDLAFHTSKVCKVDKKLILQAFDSYLAAKEEVKKGPITLIDDYSPQGIALIGDTRAYDILLGGSNLLTKAPKLAIGGSGWVSSKTQLDKVKHFLRSNKIEFITKQRATFEPPKAAPPKQPAPPVAVKKPPVTVVQQDDEDSWEASDDEEKSWED
jgi:hypothetical protein